MKTKLLTVALLASAALVAPVQGGDSHGNSGGNYVASGRGGSARGSVASSFRSAPMRNYSGGRTIYSGQRFSSAGLPSSRSMNFRPHYVNSNVGSSIGTRQFTSGNINRTNQFAAGNINRGNNIAPFSNTNRTITNLRRGGNAPNLVRNGNNNLRGDWRNHVFAQRSANWQHNWNRSSDHWWHGHRCHFFNGAWFIFDFGFDPWWPYWYYPSDYYAYGYGYPYQYDYDQGYYDSGTNYDQNSYADQSGDSNVAAVQQVLAQQGYYRGQIDGEFGPETRAALAEYQSNHGLRVTGTLTPDTLQALGLPRAASY